MKTSGLTYNARKALMVNIGESAGQSVNHAHLHVIPRYRGDHPAPEGGVRTVTTGSGERKVFLEGEARHIQ